MIYKLHGGVTLSADTIRDALIQLALIFLQEAEDKCLDITVKKIYFAGSRLVLEWKED